MDTGQSLMDPGPKDKGLLYLQSEHRSEAIWDGEDPGELMVKRTNTCIDFEQIDDRIKPYLERAGFLGFAHIGSIPIDHRLITALVERWRPETHTFHFVPGESTITLEDVVIQTGLPVEGQAVIGCTDLNWRHLCVRLLGVEPTGDALQGSRLKMAWLRSNFAELSNVATEKEVKRYARAYILRLIGGLIFPDKSSSRVHLMFLPLLKDFDQAGQYSWGSACLAWLYRELCRAANRYTRDIAGATILLQLWAWDRLPCVAPRIRHHVHSMQNVQPLGSRWKTFQNVSEVFTHTVGEYRMKLDRQSDDEIIWLPYTNLISLLGDFCTRGRELGLAKVPLICFHIIEWHNPDRVVRQFGLQQPIPRFPYKCDELHEIDLRGKETTFWEKEHREWVNYWCKRHKRLVHGGQQYEGRSHFLMAYLKWYQRHTRRWISREGAVFGIVADGLAIICRKSTPNASASDIALIHKISYQLLRLLNAESLICGLDEAVAPPMQIPGIPSAPGQRGHRCMGPYRGRHETRETSRTIPSTSHPPDEMQYFPDVPSFSRPTTESSASFTHSLEHVSD